ncbi:MAG: DUF2461 domain-containing protein [Acidimicrobiales bacterium]
MPTAKLAKRAQPPAAFGGWSTAALDFFEDLEVDNTKSWWSAHKDLYETKVRAPMEALLAELASEFGEGKIFRPYRDVRFSADKTPYKTNIAAVNAGGYISLSAGSLGVGSGLYMPSSTQLSRFRQAIANDRTGPELERIVATLRNRQIDVSAHEVLKTAPRGYGTDHPRIDLLRQKGLTAWKEWPVGPWLATAQAKRRIVDILRATAPLREWLEQHAGADGS